MTVRKKIASMLAAIGLLAGGLAITAGPALAAPNVPTQAKAWDSETGEVLAQWACKKGRVCFWKGFNGTGKRCMWRHKDPNWLAGAIKCSWSDTANVRSVWNRKGGYEGVVYYYNKNYGNRIGCTKPGKSNRGNLAGTYAPRSHRWTEGSCG